MFTAEEYALILENATGADKYMWPLVVALDEKWGDRGIAPSSFYNFNDSCIQHIVRCIASTLLRAGIESIAISDTYKL